MAATNKDDLTQIAQKEFEKLSALLDQVPDDFAVAKDDQMTSIKDVVGHRAHWIDLFLGWYVDGQDGKPVYFPAKGYKWNELKRYNASLREQQSGLRWNEAKALLETAHERLMSFIDAHSNQELYGAPMKGANNDWTAGRWAEAAGPSHFRSASKYIRARLRQMT